MSNVMPVQANNNPVLPVLQPQGDNPTTTATQPIFNKVKTNLTWAWDKSIQHIKTAATYIKDLAQRIATAIHDFFAPKYHSLKTSICNCFTPRPVPIQPAQPPVEPVLAVPVQAPEPAVQPLQAQPAEPPLQEPAPAVIAQPAELPHIEPALIAERAPVALQAARLNNQAADYVPFLGEGAALAIADVPLAAPAPQAPAPAADPANAAAPAAVEPAAQPAPARRGLFWWVPGW